MTIKQRKFAKAYAKNGGNGKAAAIVAGYSPTSAKSTASDLLHHNFTVQAALYRLMDRKGLTDSKLLNELSDGIQKANTGFDAAKRVISARVIIRSDDPTVKTKTATARTDDFIEVEDHQAKIGYLRTKHDYLQTGFKLRGYLTPAQEPTGPKSVTIIYGHNVAAQTVVKVTSDLPGSDGPSD